MILLCSAFALVVSEAWAQEVTLQETDIPGISAELLYLTRHESVTTVAILLRNSSDQEVAPPGSSIDFNMFALIDPANSRKYLPLTDQDGRYLAGPISDWNDGGRWFIYVPPRSSQTVWAMFEPVEPGTVLNVEAPLLPPFYDVEVDSTIRKNSGSESATLSASVVSVSRGNNQLRVTVRIARSGSTPVMTDALRYDQVWLLDPASLRKYALLRDTEGLWVARPVTDEGDGGRFFFHTINPDGQVSMYLTFTPPPDAVREVQLLLPFFPPIGPLEIEGTAGASETGTALEGRSLGLDAALEDLEAKVTDAEIRIDLAADVLFDFDSADIKPEAAPSLQKLASVLEANLTAKVSIEGHTDAKGTDDYNMRLSERRAASVKQWLLSNAQVDGSNLTTRGWGKSKPVAPNTKADGTDDPEGRAKNRRVEIIVQRA